MYLSSIEIINFRKFRNQDNIVSFVCGIEKNSDKASIAKNTTLIVGRNNSGKTTIIKALEKICKAEKFYSKDFNLDYLNEWINSNTDEIIDLPYIEFRLVIGLDHSTDDYINNISSFMPISNIDPKETKIKIILRYHVLEEILFKEVINNEIASNQININILLEVIDKYQHLWGTSYYSEDGREIKNFKLSNLIEIVSINAIHIKTDTSLTSEFNKIINSKFKNNKIQSEEIENAISELNSKIDISLCQNETFTFNSICKDLMNRNVNVHLSSDLSKEKILSSNILKYQYKETTSQKRERLIPENQFGLGYSNIVMIVAEVINYIEEHATSAFHSKINIISIEEPETHMHPQMQEMFIANIDKAIDLILTENKKNINSQIIITTHSPHILNSKIHEGNSFSDINFITEQEDRVKIISFNDSDLIKNTIVYAAEAEKAEAEKAEAEKAEAEKAEAEKAEAEKAEVEKEKRKVFNFITKHITFGMTDLFFADAAILVEGISEMKLIPFFINYFDKYKDLKANYISIVNVGGAFAYLYKNILEKLNIPVAIITDIDIKKTSSEKESPQPITSLEKRCTTNKTLAYFFSLKAVSKNDPDYGNNKNSYWLDEKCMENHDHKSIGIFYQTKESDIYPTSLEEALYIANINTKCNDNCVYSILNEMHPTINKKTSANKVNNSAFWQKKLTNEKGDFSSLLLYKLMTDSEYAKAFKIPQYIDDAFTFLKASLEGSEQNA